MKLNLLLKRKPVQIELYSLSLSTTRMNYIDKHRVIWSHENVSHKRWTQKHYKIIRIPMTTQTQTIWYANNNIHHKSYYNPETMFMEDLMAYYFVETQSLSYFACSAISLRHFEIDIEENFIMIAALHIQKVNDACILCLRIRTIIIRNCLLQISWFYGKTFGKFIIQ